MAVDTSQEGGLISVHYSLQGAAQPPQLFFAPRLRCGIQPKVDIGGGIDN
jgi:hypothetical protein